MTDPREQMRNLIAETEGKRRNGAASDGRGWYRTQSDRDECYAVADAVMELFPDVSVDLYLDGHRYELHTAFEPLTTTEEPS